jgi:hypothetical protein
VAKVCYEFHDPNHPPWKQTIRELATVTPKPTLPGQKEGKERLPRNANFRCHKWAAVLKKVFEMVKIDFFPETGNIFSLARIGQMIQVCFFVLDILSR